MTKKPVKLFPPLLKIVTKTVTDILTKNLSIDKTIQPLLKDKKLGSRDRKFIIEHTYDIIRNNLLLEDVLKALEWIVDVNHKILINLIRKEIDVINPELILKDKVIEANQILELYQNNKNRSVRIQESFPEWLWAKGEKEYGTEWPNLATSLNNSARIYLRPNTLITSKEKLANKLESQGIETQPRFNSDALVLKNRDNLRNHVLYRKGHFEIQDWASQQLAYFANLQPDNLIIDACAGAGGKTLHLAALKKEGGRLIATDYEFDRMKQLRYRMERAKAKEIEIIQYDTLKEFTGNVDRLILDAPCSATGTIRRKAEIKWNLSQSQLNKYIKIQEGLLSEHTSLIKLGGLMIYATCSIFKCESEDQVANFLSKHTNFELVKEQRYSPVIDDCDGFYIGVVQRVG